jgi:hypothetical protein
MQTDLSKDGKGWQITVSGASDEKPFVKKFPSLADAEDWRRDVVQGREAAPELKPIKAKKASAKKK